MAHFGIGHYDPLNPSSFLQPVGATMNLGGWFGESPFQAPSTGRSPSFPEEVIARGIEAIGGLFGEQGPAVPGGAPQVPTITRGAIGSLASCWSNVDACGRPITDATVARRYSRRRIKQVRVRDTSELGWHWELQEACAPRRMNYCNPRALGRAARRLGGFQAMAAGVDRIIQTALKRKGVRRRSASYGKLPYCGPARSSGKRCR